MSDEAITFYWRPGCGFCMLLERRLSRHDLPVEKRNIWEDPEAAAFVRSVARGNETVPTVVVGGHAMVNPSFGQVIAALQEHAREGVPDSVADGPTETRGLLGRLFG